MSESSRRYAVIIPACNEEPCIRMVIDELRAVLDPATFAIAVGVNDSRDDTAGEALRAGAIVGQTDRRGYGFGCRSAIDELARRNISVDGYIFVAGDGANDPHDIRRLVEEHQRGATLVLGSRTQTPGNWTFMNFHYVVANRLFGFVCGMLTGRFFHDLGPLRLISRDLFEELDLREWTYGWTIEAQVRAALLGAKIVEIPVRERGRCAGTQKVSHVSMWRTLSVGAAIVAAGIRTRWRTPARAHGRSALPSIPVGGLNAGTVTGVMGVSKS